jgi:hypothetical protein
MKNLITFFRKKIDELSCDDDFEFCDLKFLRENKKDFILFKNNISAIKKQLLPVKADLIKEDTILDIEMLDYLFLGDCVLSGSDYYYYDISNSICRFLFKEDCLSIMGNFSSRFDQTLIDSNDKYTYGNLTIKCKTHSIEFKDVCLRYFKEYGIYCGSELRIIYKKSFNDSFLIFKKNN